MGHRRRQWGCTNNHPIDFRHPDRVRSSRVCNTDFGLCLDNRTRNGADLHGNGSGGDGDVAFWGGCFLPVPQLSRLGRSVLSASPRKYAKTRKHILWWVQCRWRTVTASSKGLELIHSSDLGCCTICKRRLTRRCSGSVLRQHWVHGRQERHSEHWLLRLEH